MDSSARNRYLLICLNWNKASLTIQFVEKILQYHEVDVCIIDNNSCSLEREKLLAFVSQNDGIIIEENTIEWFDERHKLYLILKDENDGYAKGNNKGLYLSTNLKYDFSIIANNDIEIVSDFSVLLCEIENLNIQWDFVAPMILSPNGRMQSFDFRIQTYRILIYKFLLLPVYLKSYRLYTQKSISSENKFTFVERLPGCFFIGKTSSFKKINFFDENTFLYGEENILAIKAERSRLNTILLKEQFVLHQHETTTNLLSNTNKIFIDSTVYTIRSYFNKNKFSIVALKISYYIYLYFWIFINRTWKKFRNESRI